MIPRVTGTYVSYYHYCKRRLWLFANEIRMEENSDYVKEGLLIGQNTYTQRPEKCTEISFEAVKIDFFDVQNRTIHETKRSDSFDHCDEAQLKFYIRVLERNGLKNVKGILEYPKLKQIINVEIDENDRKNIDHWEEDIFLIINNQHIPNVINCKKCNKCSYFEFCYV